jgi:phosphoribosyl-AMP cyclohydrolase
MPQKNNPAESQYREALRTHDWYYSYSDDHQAWKKGEESSKTLSALQKFLDPDYSIWNLYAPDDCKVKVKARKPRKRGPAPH